MLSALSCSVRRREQRIVCLIEDNWVDRLVCLEAAAIGPEVIPPCLSRVSPF